MTKDLGYPQDAMFDRWNDEGLALTFDDVRLRTGYTEKSPDAISLISRITRNIEVKIPFVSAPMDTVTESATAIEMALQGGIGVIHYNLEVAKQASQVKRVKHYVHGIIETPITVSQDETVGSVLEMRAKKGYKFHSFPVVDDEGKVVGLMTRNDFSIFRNEPNKPISAAMTRDLITGTADMPMKRAYDLMVEKKKKALPLLGVDQRLVGMIVLTDAERALQGQSSAYNVDAKGSLRVGAAIGTREEDLDRAEKLVEAGVDLLVIDTAHADTPYAVQTIRALKNTFPHVDILVGNVSEPASARRLADAGADGIKVGQGGGSICTTRDVTGTGCPQVSAVYNCARELRGSGIPVMSDGGARSSGDSVIALACGASSVMYGSMFAGTDEAPGHVFDHEGRKVKIIRGMGSLEAQLERAGSRGRYQSGSKRIVAEGVQGVVEYKGALSEVLADLTARVRKGFWNIGAFTVPDLHAKALFMRITGSGLAEGHAHSIVTVPKLSHTSPTISGRSAS